MASTDLGGKLLNGIKGVYVNIVASVGVKGSDSECFRIDSGVRQVRIMSPCLAVMKEVKMEMGRRRVRFQEEGGEWRLPGLLYADDLFFFVNRRKTEGNGGTFY